MGGECVGMISGRGRGRLCECGGEEREVKVYPDGLLRC